MENFRHFITYIVQGIFCMTNNTTRKEGNAKKTNILQIFSFALLYECRFFLGGGTSLEIKSLTSNKYSEGAKGHNGHVSIRTDGHTCRQK